MKRTTLLAALALFATGTAVAALKANTPVFVKARNTQLLKSAKRDADVVAVLQPGDKVSWQAGPEATEFHKVKSSQGQGYVYFSSLSLKPPKEEFLKEHPTGVSAEAFASSGAATKALGEGAIELGEKKLSADVAVRSVLTMEAIARQQRPEALHAHAAKVGLVPAVGGKEVPQ